MYNTGAPRKYSTLPYPSMCTVGDPPRHVANRAMKVVDGEKNRLQVIPSSLFITTKMPNAIHGSQTQQRKVEFEEVGKTGAFLGLFCSIVPPPPPKGW